MLNYPVSLLHPSKCTQVLLEFVFVLSQSPFSDVHATPANHFSFLIPLFRHTKSASTTVLPLRPTASEVPPQGLRVKPKISDNTISSDAPVTSRQLTAIVVCVCWLLIFN